MVFLKQVNLKKGLTADNFITDQDPRVTTNFNTGKVRQLFLQRRGKGWDRSNPLEPIKTKTKPNRTQGQSTLTKSLSSLPDYYSNAGEKIELFSVPVRLPNLGVNTMNSQGNEASSIKKMESKSKSKIPQPKSLNKSSIPPTEELRKLTLSPRKIQTPERTFSPSKSKPATPGLSGDPHSKHGKLTSGEKSTGIQKGQIERLSASSKSSTPLQSPAPRTPMKNTDPDKAQCSICGRCFLKDRLKVHEGICKKSTTKKRKVFDPVKHRLAGTEAEPYLRKGPTQAKPTKSVALKPKSDWRKKHEEFIATIRAAKQVQDHLAKGGSLKDLPPPPPMDTSDYVQCPHCGRKFTEGVADRHIPICSKIKSNKSQPSKRGRDKKK
nr:uncharacterized protein LOC106681161 [Halyomorpha halys]